MRELTHTLRASALLLILLFALGWSAAGRAPQEGAEEAAPAPAAAETAEAAGTPDAARRLRVRLGGVTQEMDMASYLTGVLRAEMPASFELEALKAQAIAARTYTLYKMARGPIENHPDADACDDIACCKAYQSAADAAAEWGAMALYYEEKLARAVRETDGQAVLYDGGPILAVFCSSTNGHTQNAGAVWQTDLPYLQSVESPEEASLVPNYYSAADFTAEEFRARFLAAHPDAELSGPPEGWITELSRSDAGFVTTLRVGGVRVKGNELRTILALRSPSFTVETDAEGVHFRVVGYGHGVGMSQYGANVLAAQGLRAEEILTHYYAGTSVGAAP